MKHKVTIVSIVISTVLLLAVVFFFQKFIAPTFSSDIDVSGSEKEIFVREGSERSYKYNDPSKWTPEMRKRVKEYEADIKAIDDAHQYRMQGYEFVKSGQLDQATEAFRKAHDLEKSPDTGFLLAETYGKLGRYDDAISVLDNMIKNRETNEYGIQKTNQMKSRLLRQKAGGQVAAKNTAGQKDPVSQ